MNVTFSQALQELNDEAASGNAALEYAQAARPSTDYLLESILPERQVPSYTVENGNIVIRATMAGAIGMDSEYPETGTMTASTFLQSTAKIANAVTIPERALRQIQAELNMGGNLNMVEEALNFMNKMIIQPHMDTFEYLRGQIMTTGQIDWTFNKKTVNVDYGIPSGNILANRTGTNAYGGADSVFWSDIRKLQKALDYQVRLFVTHPDTMDAILDNPANGIKVIERNDFKYGSEYMIGKYKQVSDGAGGATVQSEDARDTITIRTYNMEGELINPADTDSTIKKPFYTAGKLTAIGRENQRGYRVGQGSTQDPDLDDAIGYTHIGPTVEGNSVGRWGRMYTPESKPMQLRGEGVTNGLPVVDVPEKIAIASTDLS